MDQKTRDRVAKLPEWAQSLIYILELRANEASKLAEARAERDETALVSTRMETGSGPRASVKVAADDAEIDFTLDPEKYSRISCQLRYDERRKETYLQVLGSRSLVGRATSSNVLKLTVDD